MVEKTNDNDFIFLIVFFWINRFFLLKFFRKRIKKHGEKNQKKREKKFEKNGRKNWKKMAKKQGEKTGDLIKVKGPTLLLTPYLLTH